MATLFNVSMKNVDLSESKLSLSLIENCNFQGAILRNTKARNVNFSNSVLENVDFSKSSLRRSIFFKAKLKGSIMNRVNLFKANFRLADISHLSEDNPIFANAILCKTSMKSKECNRDCNN